MRNVADNCDKVGGLMGFLVPKAVIVVFGEIIQQAICSRYAKTLCIVWFVMVCMAVLGWLMYVVLGEEMVEITARHRPESLKTSTASIMKGALELSKKHVRDVYTENQILSFDMLAKIFKLGHSYPLYVKDLILVDPDASIPIDVWRSDNLQTCMRVFIVTDQHLAFVKDKSEYVCIVTLEDVIDEILKKELVDEFDNYVDHMDHKSTTHRLNEINWESAAEIGTRP